MVRGNHEICSRAGVGWFRFLDRTLPAKPCESSSDAFLVSLEGLGFVVMDTAQVAEDDSRNNPNSQKRKDANAVARHYDPLGSNVSSPAWLLSHAPFNGVLSLRGTTIVADTVLQETLGNRPSPNIKMIVSGHVHIFEALNFRNADPSRPPQLVAGIGGANLDKEPDPPISILINGAALTDQLIANDFGYVVWDRSGSNWNGTLYNSSGGERARCVLRDRDLRCNESP
jgi:hypothetical protein